MSSFAFKSLLLGLILLLGIVVLAWHDGTSQDSQENQRYRTQAVDRGNIAQTVSANGTLNPVVLVNVGTQVSGTVIKIHTDFNDKVTAGDILAELDPALFQAQVRQSEAALLNAQATLELVQIKYGRTDALYRNKQIAREELDIARQQVSAASAQIKQVEAQLERDRINLRNSVIRSPIAGVVVARNVDIGQTVAASFQTPTLFQIAQDLRRMQIYTSVSEADVGNLALDSPVRFTVDAYPGVEFAGRIRQIRLNPTIQQNVVTYNVVVDVDNKDGRLLPGMTAYVAINVGERNDVLRLPTAALSFRPEDDKGGDSGRNGARVYVLEQGKLRLIPVTTGLSDNTLTEVRSGELKPGDQVVIRKLTERKENSNFRIRFM